MLSDKLDHLAAMERAATKTPWMQSAECDVILAAEDSIYGLGVADFDWGHLNGDSADEWKHEQLPNAQLVAALRNAAPELIAVIRAAETGLGDVILSCDCDGRGCVICGYVDRLRQALTALYASLPVAGETEAE